MTSHKSWPQNPGQIPVANYILALSTHCCVNQPRESLVLGLESPTQPHCTWLSVGNGARGRDQNLLEDYQQFGYSRQPVGRFGPSRNKAAMEGEHELPFCTTPTALGITPVDKLASICCLLVRTGLTKYFDWQHPRSRFPEYNHFLFLKCVNKGKMNSKLFLWSWDFEVNKYECAINAVKTYSS